MDLIYLFVSIELLYAVDHQLSGNKHRQKGAWGHLFRTAIGLVILYAIAWYDGDPVFSWLENWLK